MIRKILIIAAITTTLGACSGKNGAEGDQGETGATGAQGEQGIQGETGAQGEAGIDGTNGTNGTDGIDGTNGTNGTDGIDGTNGTDGIDGTNGTNGTDGIDGTNGTDGAQGEQGIQGEAGAQGEAGIDGTNGTDGIDGTDGAQGEQGIQGEAGVDGVDGQDGADSAEITPDGFWVRPAPFDADDSEFVIGTTIWTVQNYWWQAFLDKYGPNTTIAPAVGGSDSYIIKVSDSGSTVELVQKISTGSVNSSDPSNPAYEWCSVVVNGAVIDLTTTESVTLEYSVVGWSSTNLEVLFGDGIEVGIDYYNLLGKTADSPGVGAITGLSTLADSTCTTVAGYAEPTFAQ